MKHLVKLVALAALVGGLGGCASFAVVPGQQGKAYVVKATPFGSTFWNCDASTGKPKCYKVVKQ